MTSAELSRNSFRAWYWREGHGDGGFTYDESANEAFSEVIALREKIATSDTHMGELIAELAKMKAINAELADSIDDFLEYEDSADIRAKARAALAKAKGDA